MEQESFAIWCYELFIICKEILKEKDTNSYILDSKLFGHETF
jgi:hypothetical protein